jgi:hypothetical protein
MPSQHFLHKTPMIQQNPIIYFKITSLPHHLISKYACSPLQLIQTPILLRQHYSTTLMTPTTLTMTRAHHHSTLNHFIFENEIQHCYKYYTSYNIRFRKRTTTISPTLTTTTLIATQSPNTPLPFQKRKSTLLSHLSAAAAVGTCKRENERFTSGVGTGTGATTDMLLVIHSSN